LTVPPGGDDTETIEFLRFVRRPGRAMQLIARPPFPAAFVRFGDRLPAPAHETLVAQITVFRAGQRHLEAAAGVPLTRVADDAAWRYEGPAFSLESTADAMLTREAIVGVSVDRFDRLWRQRMLELPLRPPEPLSGGR